MIHKGIHAEIVGGYLIIHVPLTVKFDGQPVVLEPPRMTPRQRTVFELLRRGLSNKQIASALGLAETTIKFHVENVLRATGLTTRGEVIARYGSGIGQEGKVVKFEEAS